MIPCTEFSLHADIVRYRGEDVARLLMPHAGSADAFIQALGCAPDLDTRTLEQDITDLEQELDLLRSDAAEALKFLALNDLLTVTAILERMKEEA